MNVWKLEWLRLLRTKRWLVLLIAFVAFGILGPFIAKYTPELIGKAGGDIKITVPPPVPADGLTNYLKNGLQIGLIVAIVVAASALAIDAKSGLSIFYKTRLTKATALLAPRYLVVTAATTATFTLGALTAWYETVILLGTLPISKTLVGILLVNLYLAFSTAIVAVCATFARSVLGTVGLSLVSILLLPIIGIYHPAARWLPSYLAGSMDALARNQQISDFTRSAVMAAIATIALLLIALYRINRRELD